MFYYYRAKIIIADTDGINPDKLQERRLVIYFIMMIYASWNSPSTTSSSLPPGWSGSVIGLTAKSSARLTAISISKIKSTFLTTLFNQPSDFLASKYRGLALPIYERLLFLRAVRAIVGDIDKSIGKMEQFDHAAIISDALAGRSMLWRHAHSC